jgi:hypothetical protein
MGTTGKLLSFARGRGLPVVQSTKYKTRKSFRRGRTDVDNDNDDEDDDDDMKNEKPMVPHSGGLSVADARTTASVPSDQPSTPSTATMAVPAARSRDTASKDPPEDVPPPVMMNMTQQHQQQPVAEPSHESSMQQHHPELGGPPPVPYHPHAPPPTCPRLAALCTGQSRSGLAEEAPMARSLEILCVISRQSAWWNEKLSTLDYLMCFTKAEQHHPVQVSLVLARIWAEALQQYCLPPECVPICSNEDASFQSDESVARRSATVQKLNQSMLKIRKLITLFAKAPIELTKIEAVPPNASEFFQ